MRITHLSNLDSVKPWLHTDKICGIERPCITWACNSMFFVATQADAASLTKHAMVVMDQ